MKTRFLALAASALAALAGCSAKDSSVEVGPICSYPATCTFNATCGSTLLNKPWVDLSVTDEMVVFAEIRNRRAQNADAGTRRTNTADALVDRYRVSIAGAPEQVIHVGPYPVPAGGSAVVPIWLLVPGSGAAGALPAGPSPGVPHVAEITIEGEYVDGSSFDVEHDIPFYACLGCWDPACTAACPGVGQIGICTDAAPVEEPPAEEPAP